MRPSLIILFLFCLGQLIAVPNPIKPITHEKHDVAYYQAQAQAWKKITESDECVDPMAWYNYYLASHFANLFGNSMTFDLDKILAQASQELTEADFALHYLRCRRAKDADSRWQNLRAAYLAEPERPESYPGLAIYHLLEGNTAEYADFMQKLDAKMPFPGGTMEWSYNQLQSVGENGLLITHGDNDTYATLMLQAVYGLRPDVEVINLSLFSNFEQYRDRVSRKIGITPPALRGEPQDTERVIESLIASKRPVHLGVGAHDNLIAKLADRMYLTGLTYRYAEQPFNNLGTLVDNYLNRWRTEALHESLATGPAQAVADELNRNYLPALLELHQHFIATNPEEAVRIEKTVRTIAARNGLANSIDRFFQPEVAPIASNDPGLKAKQIAKSFRLIPAGIYEYRTDEKGNFVPILAADQGQIKSVELASFWLGEYEVSNADYQLFLQDLLRQRRFDLLDSAAIVEADYNAFLAEDQRDPANNSLYREENELLRDHPVTSIAHQAAALYAQWLTEVYNQDPKRKDGRKVRFRLPTADELAFAARGGRKYSPYPWGGPYVANAKGCFLANFNTTLIVDPVSGASLWDYANKTQVMERAQSLDGNCNYASDGGLFTVAVDGYFPNDYGIYNLSGNAAEMIDQPGIDLGGGWSDHIAYLEIGRQQKRATPHPAVGFRLVMEYVD